MPSDPKFPMQPGDILKSTQEFLEKNKMGEMMGQQAERFWQGQNEMLTEFEGFVHNWTKRRLEANEAARHAAETMAKSQDVTQSLQVMNQWFTDSLSRMQQDTQDQYELMMKMVNKVAAAPAPDSDKK